MAQDRLADVEVYRRLLGYVIPFWYAFLLSILGFLIYSVSNVAFVQLLAYIVDSIEGADPILESEIGRELSALLPSDQAINRIVVPVSMVLIAFFRGIGSFCGLYFISVVATSVVHALRCQLFDQMLKLPSSFYDRNALGHLVARVTYNVTQVTGAATDAIKVLIREGFTVLGYLLYLLYLNWRLTLLFFLVTPFIYVLVTYAGKRFRRISKRIQHSMGDVTHVASEAVQGYRVVRTFGGVDYERRRFAGVSNDNRRQSLKMSMTAAVNSPAIQFIVSIVLALLVWLVLEPRLLADMSAGKVIAFLSTAGLLAKPIRQLSEVNATVQSGLAAAKDIFELFDEPVEVDSGRRELASVRGKLEFRAVSFAYDNDGPQVLQDVSFIAQPGQTVAIVGRSGSGKTTLASLIPRFYLPQSGQILLDDVPIEELRLDNLRQHIGMVSQHVTLFNDTVARNIAYGDLAASTEEAIRSAAARAYALQFIDELEHGLQTVVGDDGAILSGGQRQRMAIARAFLKNAPILILDEATSALDSESERYIQAALDDVLRGRTTLVIAHRLSTIEKADLILVMENGRIIERGRHEALLAAGGAYARLHAHQFADEKSPGEVTPEPWPANRLPALRLPQPNRFGLDINPLVDAWYGNAGWVKLLRPLSWVYSRLQQQRQRRLAARQWRPPVPVIVVGNITVGGTGKTPLVLWLAQSLRRVGYQPGIVLRGYGGAGGEQPVVVDARTDPALAGDEAVVLAARADCPVVVHRDRVAAVRTLLEQFDCNLVLSDDGLQHLTLGRDFEIVVIDGARGIGNGLLLPAGPLREPATTLRQRDLVVVNGDSSWQPPCRYLTMRLIPEVWVNLATQEEVALSAWAGGRRVRALAGIGNPERFFVSLEQLGFEVLRHPQEDHQVYQPGDLEFGDDLPVVMTEKDAIKCRRFAAELSHSNFWYLRVRTEIEPEILGLIQRKLAGLSPGATASNRVSRVNDG